MFISSRSKIILTKKVIDRVYSKGDLVLKWDAERAKPGRYSKFDVPWSGPYVITSCK